jgi:flagellar protein FlgJ
MNFAIPATTVTATAPPAQTVEHRKLVDAAQQFEGMLLQELLKPMREHGFSQEGTGDADENGGGTLSSFGAESVATAIAKGGGLGIAKRVVEDVERERTAHSPSSTPGGNVPGNLKVPLMFQSGTPMKRTEMEVTG